MVKNEYIKKENVDSYSFYDITEFGEGIINNLMNAIQVPQSSNYLIQTLDENSTTSPMTRIMLNLDSNDSKFNVDCAAASDSVIKVLLNQSEATMMAN